MARSRIVNLDNLQQFTAVNVLFDPGHIGGPVVVPNAARMIIRWGLTDGKVAHNVVGLVVAGGWTATAAEAEAARVSLVAGANWTAFAAVLSTGTSLQGVDLLDIRTANLPLVSSTGASTPGTSASPAMPSETAIVATIRTARSGPGGRGRLYLPGFATNAIAAGDLIAASTITACTGFLSNILTACSSAGGSWGVVFPARAQYTGSTGTVHPARPAAVLPQTGVSIRDNHWDSQRRRGLK